MPTDTQQTLCSKLRAFSSTPLREASLNLLSTLGYESDKTVDLGKSKPEDFLKFLTQSNPQASFDKEKALFEDWSSADLLFQLTKEELSGETSLFQESDIDSSLLKSYLFFSIELNGKSAVNNTYARGKLTAIARQINRVFPMPVLVLIKHQKKEVDVLSIAVINRRPNKSEQHKDVLGKVTIIRDISLDTPHRGHLDILNSFAMLNLQHLCKTPINNFDSLHTAWEEIFNVELLNKRFYKELSNWYFWALPQVDFPDDAEPDGEKRRATGLIRLLTRLIFCWFIKEKDLIPEKLFHHSELAKILRDFDPTNKESSQYYYAILQNLFFATLNQPMGKKGTQPSRRFITNESFQGKNNEHGVTNLFRYKDLFSDPDSVLDHFADIPFLNGGLFECLDREDPDDKNRLRRIDGFTKNVANRPRIPNHLFFADEVEDIDLSETYGNKKRKKECVSGLLHILNRYKFTIVENTPIDQEIALDPELLGKVFENLLASYNEETKTTARKQTGSFYTPRPIVDYMVDEALKSHLAKALIDKANASREDAKVGLDILFAYTEKEHAFSPKELKVLIESINGCKILDPACGSGAFPMGMLHKLVFILGKLDPSNDHWKQLQLDAAKAIPDSTACEAAQNAIQEAFKNNEGDYGRKLYLIENCLYGVDIQPIAIQISKLRFFISLVCDQKTNRDKAKNHGIRPLPNLETKFVAADTLIGLEKEEENWTLGSNPKKIKAIERELQQIRHEHFTAENRQKKIRLHQRDKELRDQLATELESTFTDQETSLKLARWNPYDPHNSADFFEPRWMFDHSLSNGFDILIGNPPYISVERFANNPIQTKWKDTYQTYAGRGDIYCLFYERGAQLLREGGSLVYITSNKWMRNDYGKALRGFLSSKVDTESVLDFDMAQIFGEATTYTCITRFYKQPPNDCILFCEATDGRAAIDDPAAYFAENKVEQSNFTEDAWVVFSKERQRIKSLVKEQGIPLEKWDLSISRGITTGCNDAFCLSSEQRNTLINEDPASEELIGKLIRGKDVERYGVNWEEIYLILIKSGAHEYLEERYPAIFYHLSKFETKLKARASQRKYKRAAKPKDAPPTWLEMDSALPDSYLKLLTGPKILCQRIAQKLPFYFDQDGDYVVINTCFIITSSQIPLEALTATLNSSLFRACFKDNFPKRKGNSYEVSKSCLEKIPLKQPSASEGAAFAKLVPLIQFAKADQSLADYQFLEELADACVMESYFHQHMAERDLLFLDELSPSLDGYDLESSEPQQREFLKHFIATHNAPSAKIRNRLFRITADSPDLLAVIKQEGKV